MCHRRYLRQVLTVPPLGAVSEILSNNKDIDNNNTKVIDNSEDINNNKQPTPYEIDEKEPCPICLNDMQDDTNKLNDDGLAVLDNCKHE